MDKQSASENGVNMAKVLSRNYVFCVFVCICTLCMFRVRKMERRDSHLGICYTMFYNQSEIVAQG